MIEGEVNAHYEAVVHLLLLDSSGQARDVEAVIDTGFNGFLTLPPALVSELGLIRLGQKSLLLANGSRDIFDTYGVTVLWDRQPRFVDADEADASPLIGMALLNNHSLYEEVEDGGRVVIQAKE